ncbi:hypothetical protein JW613_05545 [Streptomyces smyrnaeus]|uniref:Uncharacterized protein n=1 Tax=Streptomyces smyrnaeus TaxID=1387713 RepID=A0ABS3XRS2_9ACTN|nr:hypothetical protein [Streptomyces smyrnaeus]MBO8197766.1 hypothetical protein [Streptomyces smyrnaeus]
MALPDGTAPLLVVRLGDETLRLTLREARHAVYGARPEERVGEAVWRHAVAEARNGQADTSYQGADPTDQMTDYWQLFLIWLAIPGLYRTVRRITDRFRIDREDVEAEAVLALLDEIETVDLSRPGVGSQVVRGAAGRMWGYAARTRREVPVVDITSLAVARHGAVADALDDMPRESWELHVTPPGDVAGLAATLRFTESATCREGARLGALAQSIGLTDIVLRARRPRAGVRIGTLALRPAGAGR